MTESELWLPDFEHAHIVGKPGVKLAEAEPKSLRVRLASGTVSSAVEAYRSCPPHAVVDFRTGQRIQHISLDRAAYLLDDTEEPSTDMAIQIEVVGRTDDARNWPEPMVTWLGYEVFAPIRAIVALAEEAAPTPPTTGFAEALRTLSAAGHDMTDGFLDLRGRITAAAQVAASRRKPEDD